MRGRARMLTHSKDWVRCDPCGVVRPRPERGHVRQGTGQPCHMFVREVFVSPASSTSKPSELHEHVIQQLIERGRTQGYLEADDVRRAFEDADIPVSKASTILRSLSKEGVTVMVSAADSAAPKRSRKRATSAARKSGADAGTAARADAGPDETGGTGETGHRNGTGKSVSAAKEQPDTVTAVVDGGAAVPTRPTKPKSKKK